MFDFTKTPTIEIIKQLKEELKHLNAKESVAFEVFNPDNFTSTYERGYKSWVDLAQILHCKMMTPLVVSSTNILLQFEKLNFDDSFHKKIIEKEEKYGTLSIFSQIDKMQEPSFVHNYMQALQNVTINKRSRILNLGVNSGDEFEIIVKYVSNFKNLELVGVDYCSSAIKEAQKKFKEFSNISFINHDINDLSSLNFGQFDLIISIGTLQSSNLEFNPLFMSIVQNQLKRSGAIVLGFPNCRWIDGEMIYGARVKNYAFSEMGLLYKDVVFCKKYLQQKKFRVTITGKDYIFLTATSIRLLA